MSMEQAKSAVPDLLEKLSRKECTVGIVGLGYVGLPLCLAIASAGLQVIGFDIDRHRVGSLISLRSYFEHIPDLAIESLLASRRFQATDDFRRLNEPDAILVCVPTPLTPHREPDLSFIISAGRAIAQYMRRGQLIVLESTTYPGTTEEVLRPILESTGMISGRDFFLAYSPEREDPGNPSFTTADIPKIIGGLDAGRDLAVALYSSFVTRIVPVSSVAVAEAVKLAENVFRAVNIALVNELKMIFDAMGLDVWEVIEAAKTKPFGFMPFYPGPGIGGHCVPIDPYYLTWKAQEYGLVTQLIELAGQINTGMPQYVVNQLALALDRQQKIGLNGSRILVVGLGYKKNIDDTRESPALRLIELIEARGATADFFDPFVATIPVTRKSLAGRTSFKWDIAALSIYNAAVIATDHDCIDYASLVNSCRLVIDTRNACRRAGIDAPHVVRA
ncbi:nucleotide sugar dehydrogenase [Bradyrhizobium betae]|uniref:nucleotide sugar dehydrogenase n=1 Tax=Bradyrhizobium betae TaxID=244734 RepID=UPI003D66CC95